MAVSSSRNPDPRTLLTTEGLRASRSLLPKLVRDLEQACVDRAVAEARINVAAETIRIVTRLLPDTEQADYRRRVDEIRSGVGQNRGGELYGNVIALFRRDQRPEWTVPDAQAALAQNGMQADTKALYNTFVYLANTGRLHRVARGRYVVTGYGVEIETSDEMTRDDGTQRVSEHDV